MDPPSCPLSRMSIPMRRPLLVAGLTDVSQEWRSLGSMYCREESECGEDIELLVSYGGSCSD